MNNITFEKQNLPFDAEPNTASPSVVVAGNDVILAFPSSENENIGEITFKDCLMYRIGDPNDEGFYSSRNDDSIKNDSAFSMEEFPELQFGYFYKVHGMNWRNGLLGAGEVVLDSQYRDKADFSHYVFFMKDGTFECVTKDYRVR